MKHILWLLVIIIKLLLHTQPTFSPWCQGKDIGCVWSNCFIIIIIMAALC